MNLTSHAAVGAAVGYATGNPILAFVAGYISHHLIDTIPHTDGGSLHVPVTRYAKDKRVLAIVGFDLLLLILLTFILIKHLGFNSSMIMGAVGGVTPDLIDNMPFWSAKIRKIFPFYHKIHEFFHYTIEEQEYLWVGIATQILLIALSLFFLL